jgi:acetylornithine deacetylase
MSLDAILQHLGELIACDTQNPPRQIDGDSRIFHYCASQLPGDFSVETWDHGDGHVSFFACRGNPKILFNVHLDTVPAGEGWNSDPHRMVVVDDRVYGRGACDIKGAAAALLTLAQQEEDDLALLFTSDEEGAGGCCISKFLDTGIAGRFEQVIVAEPTGCRAILGHRGFLSVKTRFHGTPGHSSEARALRDNANHQMVRWAARALQVAAGKKASVEDAGSCMNIGIIDGGTKSNVIAGGAFVHWSARLQPGESNEGFLDEIRACAPPGSEVEWEVPFSGAPLPAEGSDDRIARAYCTRNGLEMGEPVDFWTEAALFSAAGFPSLVLGPGMIEQAHVANEWVATGQLERAFRTYGRVVKNDG